MSLDIDRSVMTSMKEDRHGEGPPGWGDLLRGRNLIRSVALCGSVALHAINLYLSTTILPSVVADIGGRSEERRVGKEGRSGGERCQQTQKKKNAREHERRRQKRTRAER